MNREKTIKFTKEEVESLFVAPRDFAQHVPSTHRHALEPLIIRIVGEIAARNSGDTRRL